MLFDEKEPTFDIRGITGRSSRTISAKPDGVRAASEPSILGGSGRGMIGYPP